MLALQKNLQRTIAFYQFIFFSFLGSGGIFRSYTSICKWLKQYSHSYLTNEANRWIHVYMIELMSCRIHWIRRDMTLFSFFKTTNNVCEWVRKTNCKPFTWYEKCSFQIRALRHKPINFIVQWCYSLSKSNIFKILAILFWRATFKLKSNFINTFLRFSRLQ